MSKLATLLLIAVLVLSSSVMVGSAFAQTIPNPSVPEFTVTGQSISGWGDSERVRIAFTIKNQPFTPYTEPDSSSVDLFYNVSWKGHDAKTWIYYHHNIYQVDYFKATSSNETFILLDLSGSELGGMYGGGQADIRVQALIGGYIYSRKPYYPMDVYDVEFTGQTSDWSKTQTITIPEGQKPTPSPTTTPTSTHSSAATFTPPQTSPPPTTYPSARLTELEIIIGVAIAVAVIGAGLGSLIYLIKRK